MKEYNSINVKRQITATPDWNIPEGEAGHIANRTHYDQILPYRDEISIENNNIGVYGQNSIAADLAGIFEGTLPDEVWINDGTNNICADPVIANGELELYHNSSKILTVSEDGNDELTYSSGTLSGTYTVTYFIRDFRMLDTKYLPQIDVYINQDGNGYTSSADLAEILEAYDGGEMIYFNYNYGGTDYRTRAYRNDMFSFQSVLPLTEGVYTRYVYAVVSNELTAVMLFDSSPQQEEQGEPI